ncbi:MAG: site-2 protease family protein [Candidatus Methanofastidiosia archaeon]
MDTIVKAIILFFAVWSLVKIIDVRIDLSKKNIEVGPFQFIARTNKLTSTIDRIARGGRPFWIVFSFVGIVTAFGGMFLTTANFLFIGKMMLHKPDAVTGVQIVIPGITLPLTYSVVALATVVVVHEFSHGIVARIEKIPLKSVGVGILAILPFAFAEPDEEGMKKSSVLSRVKVFAAGSMANFTLALISLAVIFAFVVPSLSATGLVIGSVEGGSPGEMAGLKDGMIIESIVYDEKSYMINSYEDFYSVMDNTFPADIINVVTDKGSFSFLLGNHPTKDVGYIGIVTYDRSMIRNIDIFTCIVYPPIVMGIDPVVFPNSFSSGVWFLINCLKYIFFLNLGIGLFNTLPIIPLDGGRIFKEVTDKFFSKNVSSVISTGVSVGIGILIVASLIAPYIF